MRSRRRTFGAQYQAKSIRANEAKDLAALAGVVAPAGQPRDDLVAKLNGDASRFETEQGTGKAAIAANAKAARGGARRGA